MKKVSKSGDFSIFAGGFLVHLVLRMRSIPVSDPHSLSQSVL